MVDFYGKLVGRYTVRPMDPLGFENSIHALGGSACDFLGLLDCALDI